MTKDGRQPEHPPRAPAAVYDLDLNADRDRITLYRRNRAAHRWTRAEAELIHRILGVLIPKMAPKDEAHRGGE